MGAVLLVVLLVSVVLKDAKENPEKESVSVAAEGEATVTTEPPPEMMEIITPYCTLLYPQKWENNLETSAFEENGLYIVEFTGRINDKEADLFRVIFGEAYMIQWGFLTTQSGETVRVGMDYCELSPEQASWSSEEFETLCAMQEDNNYIMNALFQMEGFQRDGQNLAESATEAPGAETPTQDGTEDDILVETPYCTLRYPGRWEEYLVWETVEEDGEFAVWFCARIGENYERLFLIRFSDKGEFPIGTIPAGDESVISITFDYGTPNGEVSWSAEEQDILAAMQEGINHVIDGLKAVEGFASEQ